MLLLDGSADPAHGFQIGGQIVGDTVGGDVLGDDLPLETGDGVEDIPVVAVNLTHHVLFKALDGVDIAAPGNDFHTGNIADVVTGDQGAAVLRLEGVLYPQGDVLLAQPLGGLGVNGLHPQVGQLVGDIVVGAPDGHRIALTHQPGVGAAEVKLLVNDRLPGAGEHRHPAEGHFAVAPV